MTDTQSKTAGSEVEREADLIEKTALRVGMKSLMNHGAASCVYTEGCDGVSQEHLVAFAREVALHCVATLSHQAASSLVPGQMHCARCKFQLTRTNLYVNSGTVGAGDSKTEPCPNGCGPLWPVTWEQAAREAWATCETLFERAKAAEDALAVVNPPRLVAIQPNAAPAAPSVEREFTNELGNAIRITIEGPTSTSENVLTPMEVGQLRGALNEHAAPAAEVVAGIQEALPAGAYLRKKAEDYATQFGHNDMGALSFGSGSHADVKMDHYTTLLELADELDALATPAAAIDAREPFQQRVRPWLLECFGEQIAADREERNHRFLEEALELVQACGCTASEAHQLVDYTFGRAVGEKTQEVGGVMVTLAALCIAHGIDMHTEAETELARIGVPAIVAKIRAKQAAKPKHSPLPEEAPAARPNAAGQEQGWMPIATAPKGRKSLLYSERNKGISTNDWGDYDLYNHPKFTHWMPLPTPPLEAVGSSGMTADKAQGEKT